MACASGLGVGLAAVALLATAATAAEASPASVVLVGSPETGSTGLEPQIQVIRAATERGARAGLRDSGEYKLVVSSREVASERNQFVDPIVKYGWYAEKDVNAIVRKRYDIQTPVKLTAFIAINIWESSAKELMVDLELWSLPKWELLARKSVGGCGISFEETVENAREAARLLVGSKKGNMPIAQGRVIRRTDDGRYVHATQVLVGEEFVLDACGSRDDEHDAFLVRWVQKACTASSCVLPSAGSGRVRLPVTVPAAGTYTFELGVTPGDSVSPAATEISVVAVDKPRAVPRVLYDNRVVGGSEFKLSPNTFYQRLPPGDEEPAKADSKADLATWAGPDLDELRRLVESSPVDIVRVSRNSPRKITLDANESNPKPPTRSTTNSTKYDWTQQEGPEISKQLLKGTNPSIEIGWNKPGHYRFSLTVKNGEFTDTQSISFLVAPEVFADAGPDLHAAVGSPLALDKHGSYDALDDKPLYSWTVEAVGAKAAERCVSSRLARLVAGRELAEAIAAEAGEVVEVPMARMLDAQSRTPTFLASQPGLYTVRMFMRARRSFQDRTLWEVASDCTSILVSEKQQRTTVSAASGVEGFVATSSERTVGTGGGAMVDFGLKKRWSLHGRFLVTRLVEQSEREQLANLTYTAVAAVGYRLRDWLRGYGGPMIGFDDDWVVGGVLGGRIEAGIGGRWVLGIDAWVTEGVRQGGDLDARITALGSVGVRL